MANVSMVFTLVCGIFLCITLYRAPDRSTANNPQLVEQIAMDAAKECFENKELFSEYDLCEPMHSDSIFMDKLKFPLSKIKGQKVVLYPVSYSVKIVHSTGPWWNKSDVYISCEAKVFSLVSRRDKYRGLLYLTGLVFSEPIKNKSKGIVADGFMATNYLRYTGNGGILIFVGIMLFIAYLKFYAFILDTFDFILF
jgi:hypothetical protein